MRQKQVNEKQTTTKKAVQRNKVVAAVEESEVEAVEESFVVAKKSPNKAATKFQKKVVEEPEEEDEEEQDGEEEEDDGENPVDEEDDDDQEVDETDDEEQEENEEEDESVEAPIDEEVAAKKFHNSINAPNASKKLGLRDPKLTIVLKNNNQQLESLVRKKLEKIFAKCGEIDDMDIMCRKNILACISFKNEEAVKNAAKLNGKTEQDLELEIEEYNTDKKKTSIYVSNLPRDCTEEDLSNLFSKCGEISAIILKNGFATIHFKDSDAYCKSFLLNESFIKNQYVFVKPYSDRRQNFKRTNMSAAFNNRGRKRPSPNGNSRFMGRKPKTPRWE